MKNSRNCLIDKTNRRQKGITLIALVVTIIVLLILAGISISMLTGQNGILNRAQEAKEKTDQSQKDENQKIQEYEDIINQYSGNLPTREETKPYFPNDTFSYKEGTLSTGLVIMDSNNNEYVWVEVPKTTEVYTTAGINITNFTDEEYTKIETDLKEYTKYYKNSDYSDTKSGTTVQYKNMLKSVYENGGFWIGRYEAGIDENIPRTSHTDITENDKAIVKSDKIPYNNVTRDEAQLLATRINYGDCTGSLIYGIQWDLILKYIETKTTEKNASLDMKTKFTSNSTAIGNYYDAEFSLNRGKFAQYKALTDWYGYNNTEKTDLVRESKKLVQDSVSNSILLTTGASEANNLQNIYDIAGNVWEWTLESYTTSLPCVNRGESYVNCGSVTPANYRNNLDAKTSSYDLGFRIGLWK